MASKFWLGRTKLVDDNGFATKQAHVFLAGLTGGGSYGTLNPSGADVDIALASGANTCVRLTLTGTTYAIHAPTVAAGAPSAGDKFTLYIDQDATGGRVFPVFDTGAGNFAADFNAEAPILAASTRTIFICTFHGDVWGLDSFRTNGSIS